MHCRRQRTHARRGIRLPAKFRTRHVGPEPPVDRVELVDDQPEDRRKLEMLRTRQEKSPGTRYRGKGGAGFCDRRAIPPTHP